jgi:hypothetical protein
MSAVRPLEASDIDAVTALYYRILRHESSPPPRSLCNYMREFYLDGPYRETDIPALVHVDDDGRISGFVGVHTVPFMHEGKRLRAAFCGALMVDDYKTNPLGGARLLKAFFDGPQDISFSETANVVSQSMWEKLRGNVLTGYSMEWFRVFRPSGFGLAFASDKLRALRWLFPVARRVDTFLTSKAGKNNPGIYIATTPPGGLVTEETDRAAFADLVRQFSQSSAIYPDWSNDYLDHVLETAVDKPGFGQPVMAVVRTKSGEAIGAFLYHHKPGGIGRVLQVMAKPGQCGTVLDRLFADALSRGCVGLRGRTSPEIMEAAPGRSMSFLTVTSTVIHARNPDVAEPFLKGDCFLTGLSGERWNRFFGTEFK